MIVRERDLCERKMPAEAVWFDHLRCAELVKIPRHDAEVSFPGVVNLIGHI